MSIYHDYNRRRSRNKNENFPSGIVKTKRIHNEQKSSKKYHAYVCHYDNHVLIQHNIQ